MDARSALRPGRELVAVGLTLLLLGACSGDDEAPAPVPPSTATPTPTPTPESSPPCPGMHEALERGRPGPGRITGDVDGDGSLDEVSLVVDRSGAHGCRAYVVAATASGSIAGPVAAWADDLGLEAPRLHGVAPIDDVPGDEVVVDVGAGASTQFAAVYRATPAGFIELSPEGSDLPVFPYGGSVGHIEASDCVPGNGVVVSVAVPHEDSYRLTRTFYKATETGFALDGSPEVVQVDPRDLEDYPEYRSGLFGSCS